MIIQQQQTLNCTQQQEGQQLRVIQQPVPNQQQNQMKRKKRKHEIDGLMIKVNVSLIYGVKNKIC